MAGAARTLRGFAITLLVLLALVVAVDRIGAYVAERLAADTMQSSQHLSTRPDVSVDHAPFLTQFVSGNYPQVTVTAHNVPVGPASHPVDLSQLQVTLHHVRVNHTFSSVRAASAAGHATVTYGSLSRSFGIPVRYAGAGRITAGGISVPGASLAAFKRRLPLGNIPFGVRVRSLQADTAGIEIQLSGVDLAYSS